MSADAPSPLTALAPAHAGSAAGRRPASSDLRAVAREFESLMLLQMVKQMRQSFLEEAAPGEGLGLGTMTETMDVELVRALTAQGGLGLAAVLERGLARVVSPVAAPTSSVAPPTSGAVTEVSATPVTSVLPEANSLSLPIEGRRSSPYGWRRDPFHGRTRFHGGIDVAAAYGEPVPSAAAGRVVRAESSGGYGLMVEVEHADGLRTRYAHLSALDVTPGQELAPGQVVGRVGRSGRATGNHLHFEVLVNGRRVDPTSVLEGGAERLALKSPGPRDDSPGDQVPVQWPAME
jgi:murein DD-endopeptidase MepM/ murein hydrolase activator NlpD